MQDVSGDLVSNCRCSVTTKMGTSAAALDSEIVAVLRHDFVNELRACFLSDNSPNGIKD